MRDDIPFYIIGALPEKKRLQIEAWLEENPDAQAELSTWRLVHSVVRGHDDTFPANDILNRIHSQVDLLEKQRGTSRIAWMPKVIGALVMLVALMILWVSVKPGVFLEWKVTGESPGTFNIYRSIDGQENYYFVREVAAIPGVDSYHYTDTGILPGLKYSYRVEGVQGGLTLAVTQASASSSSEIFLVQIAILLISAFLGYSISLIMQMRIPGYLRLRYR